MQNLNERVLEIRDDREKTEQFIAEYRGFVVANVNKWTGRYVDVRNDDEVSIAMMAFYDAIKTYSSEKGNFPSYATQIIKNRLIDYYRKERKHEGNLSLNITSDEDENAYDYTIEESIRLYETEKVNENRRLEIQMLESELAEYQITFDTLTKESPKHEKLRKECFLLTKKIVENEQWLANIKRKKTLPLAEIEKEINIPRKKLERVRKYLIALVVIWSGDFESIRQFIEGGA